jgi:aryl-alcohol dehydrogenase-like predicted oxidoreductase
MIQDLSGSTATAPLAPRRLLTRSIPSSGEPLPVIGLGCSATFRQATLGEDLSVLREVLRTFANQGATVVDTAPAYERSEEVAGRFAEEAGLTDRIFWATKLNVERQRGPADPAAAWLQVETSFRRIKKARIDLIQVHRMGMGDLRTQLRLLEQLKAEGRVRYVGTTTTTEAQYPEIISAMKSEPLDFIGIDYAIDKRGVEATILPLARDRGIAVIVYLPFGRTRLFKRVGDRQLPDWAGEFDARTWAQFFLKFVISHPAVTVATPATSQARHMLDNIGGGVGRLPDEAMRKRMIAFVQGLPSAR